jgi:hypothetical protein
MKKKTWLIAAVAAVFTLLFITCGGDENDTRVTLTAGSEVYVDAEFTTTDVTFTGATGLTLENTDFRVVKNDGVNAVISAVAVNGDTANVTVTFPANEGESKQYIIGINDNSTKIKGSGSVSINHGMFFSMPNAWELDLFEKRGPSGPREYNFHGDGEFPNDTETFLDSRFLVIKSIDGGLESGFDSRGFASLQFKLKATSDNWDNDIAIHVEYQTSGVPPILAFEHTAIEEVFFVYDLSLFKDGISAAGINLTPGYANTQIIIEFGSRAAEGVFGAFSAYLTSANLTERAGDVKMLQHTGQVGPITVSTQIGWITKNPVGLVLPIDIGIWD